MSTTHTQAGVTVIGGGVIGTACALTLQREGLNVTLLERAGIGEGCSFGNAGCISPGSIVPMATPGMLAKVPGWLFDANGPLTVRWSYLLKAAPWLIRWIRAGNKDNVLRVSQALAALNGDPFTSYRSLLGCGAFDSLLRPSGHLFVWRSDTPTDSLARQLREVAGIPMIPLSAGELHEAEPALSRQFRSGLILPDNGYTVNSERLVKQLASLFTEAGGTILRRQVTGFERGPHGPTLLHTDCGSLPVSRVVIAAGAWSGRLLAMLGQKVPLETERGYHVMVTKPSVNIVRPIVDFDRKFIATPMEHGLRIAGTVEIGGLDAPPDYDRAKRLLAQGKELLPDLDATTGSMWMGYRPSTPDSLPVIDRLPGSDSVFMAFGHGHLGMTGAPRTARLLADLVLDKESEIDRAPYRLGRF